MPRHGWLLLLLLSCLFAAAPAKASAACTISWNTDADGTWETAANWNPARVPDGNDDVCIDRGAANPAVTLPTTVSARSIVNAETLKLSSLQLNQKLTNTGTIELSGNITGPGGFEQNGTLKKIGAGTSTIAQDSCCQRFDATGATFDAQTGALELRGWATLGGTITGTAKVTGGTVGIRGMLTTNSTTFDTVNINNASDILPASLAGTYKSTNANLRSLSSTGSLTATGPTHFSNGFVNTGTFTQQAATSFDGLVTNTGTWAIDGDHDVTQSANGRVQNDGTIRKSSGTGTSTLDGQIDATNAAFDARTGTLRLIRAATWATATLSSAPSAALTIAAPISATGTLTGSGTVNLTGSLSGGATLKGVFTSSATLQNLINEGELTISGGGVHNLFRNTATVRQTGNAVFSGDVTNTGLWELSADFSNAGNGRVFNHGTIRGAGRLVGRFDSTGGTFEGRNGTLRLTDQSTWTNVTVSNASIENSVSASGTLAASNVTLTGSLAGGATLSGALTSTGSIGDITNTGTLTLGNGASVHSNFNNPATVRQTGDVSYGVITNTGTWDIQGDHKLLQGTNGNFRNHNGIVRKSAGTGTATLDGTFDSTHPTFEAKQGVLLIAGQSSWTDGAVLNADANSIVRFKRNDECCWTMSISGTLTGTGQGKVEHVNGNLNGATLSFPPGYFSSTSRLNGVTNSGEITLNGASFDRLTNTGTVRQTGNVSFSGDNTSTGTWDMAGDHRIDQAANGQFKQNGTLRKSAGAGTAVLNGAFNSTHPTFSIQQGTLELGSSSTFTDGAQIDGGTFRLYRENDCCFATTINGTLTGSGRVVMDSGTLYNAKLDIDFRARGGTLAGVENAGTLELTQAHVTSNFVNSGTINQTGNAAGGYSGQIINSGTWNLAGDSGLFSTANNNFRNDGTVRRTGGSSMVTIRGNFDNRGTVEARASILAIQESTQFVNLRSLTGGTWIASGTGTLAFPTSFGIESSAANLTIDGPDAAMEDVDALRTNSGTLTLKNARLTTGNLTNTGTIDLQRSGRLTTGTFTNQGTLKTTIDGRPAGGAYGSLTATAATLGGTLAVSTGPNFAAAANDSYDIVRADSRTGAFAQTTGLNISQAAAFAPTYAEDGMSLRVAPIGDKRTALRVTTVNAVVNGENVTVTYDVINDGDPATAGAWTDSVYLSQDGAYDPRDALVGRLTQSANSYTGTLTSPLPGVLPGTYRFLVVPDSRGANLSLDPGAGARTSAPVALDLPELTTANGTVANGRTRSFKVSGTNPIQIDATGTARVLASRGAIPTIDNYDEAAAPRAILAGGPVYVTVTAGTYNLNAGPVDFGLDEITPKRANRIGQTTITITGAGFTDDAKAFLGNTQATKTLNVNGRTLLATFDLSNVTAGTYDLRVTVHGSTKTLPQSFTVNPSVEPGRLVISTQAPATFRIGSGGFFTVSFRNIGGSDVQTPLVRVTASKAVAWAITRVGASGLLSTSFFVSEQPEMIPPGAIVNVPIRFEDTGVAAHEIVRFKTELVQPDDQPINWSSRKAGLRPAGITRASWETIWPRFLAEIGTTNKSYLAALRGAAQRAAAAGRETPGEGDLLLALRERAIARATGASVSGTLQIDGKAAAGKVLTLFDENGNGGSTRTDDEGAFALWDLPNGTYTITLRGRELEPWGTVTVPSTAVNVALPGATQIAGVVRDSKGKPVREARVEGRNGRKLYLAQTDKQGRFMLDEVTPGSVVLRVKPPHAAPPAPQTVTAPNAPSLTFTVGSGAVVQGTITKPDGSAAAGALVRVGDQQAETDQAGNYIVDSLDAGTYVLSAHLAHFGSVSRAVTVATNGAATGDLRLDPEGRITGTVTPAGATVVLADPGAHHDPIEATNGTFTLDGLSTGDHTVLITAPGYASDRRTVTLTVGETKGIVSTLVKAGTIRGTAPAGATVYVRGANYAESIKAASFSFTDLPAGPYAVALDPSMTVARQEVTLGEEEVVDLDLDTSAVSGTTSVAGATVALLRDGDEVDRTVSGADGRFAFAVLASGPYTVRATRSGWGIASASGTTNLTLTPGPATLTVHTTPGAEVSAGELQAVAGADGNARFPGLPAGDYRVIARKGTDVARQTVTVPAAGTTAEVALSPAVALQGTVTAAGQPLRAASVLVTATDGTNQLAVTGTDGRWRLGGLPAGTYTVAIADGRRQLATRTATAPATVDVALADATAVTVTTQGAARAVLEDAGKPVLLATANLDGKLSLGAFEPSRTYRLTLAAPGRSPVRTTFTTDASGAPQGLPATINLGAQVSLPGATPGSGPSKVKRAAAAEESLTDKLFHMFDVAGWYIKAPARADYDTDAFRFEWAKYATNSCDPDLAADLAAARDASDKIQKAFSDWQIAYEQGRDVRSEDFAKLSAAAVQMAGQMTLLIGGLNAMGAALAAEAAAGGLTAAQSALLGVVTNTVGDLNTAYADVQSGAGLTGGWSSQVDHITSIMGSFFTAMGGIEGVSGAAEAGLGGMSNLFQFVGMMKTALVDIENLRNAVDDNIAKTVAEYLKGQADYHDALLKYKAALDRLKHYQAPPGEECPDPPPPPPPVTSTESSDEPNIEGLTSDDPNDITGPAGATAAHYLAEDSALDYTIRFENKATAALPARKVTITHTLDDDADLSTFALGSAGYGDHLVTAPARRQNWSTTIEESDDTLVEVTARLTGRTATWTFTAVDAQTGDEPSDPLAGFLAPGAGGFATYTVKALSGERKVDAQARIVFDANEHIDTNVYSNAIDTTAPTSAVNALAATSGTDIPVSWTGADTGSGIASYDVYVSVDGGAFTKWLTTPNTSATYPGAVGHRYAFHTIATDAVGHVQAAPAAAASTEVVAAPGNPPIVVTPPGTNPNPPTTNPQPKPTYKPTLTLKKGKKGTYKLTIRNAGTAADTFTIKAAKKKVLIGRKDIGKAAYTTARVLPGKTIVVTIKAKGKIKLTVTSVTGKTKATATTK